jgi:DNA mismatch endonuclease, patch repair protein
MQRPGSPSPLKSYPHPTTAAVSAVMKANLKNRTQPELLLRSCLHRRGYRFRKNLRIDVPGLTVRPDIVFTRKQLAVFVDGCFWHRCPDHGTNPRSNEQYWSAKLERNVQRDRDVDQRLQEAGWNVLRIWEHVSVEQAADLVVATLHPDIAASTQHSPKPAK